MMKAVMYHYVRPTSAQLPFLRYLSLDNFKKQLDYFQENFHFPSREEFLEVMASGTGTRNSIVLTFDDGLRDHFDFVLPEMKKRGLWGIFYIPTGPYKNRQVLGVHKIHYLLGAHGGTEMLKAIDNRIQVEMLTDKKVEAFRHRTYYFQNNSESTTEFKRTLNFYISYEWREQVLNSLMAEFFPNQSELLQKTYITDEDIRVLHREGMLIGSHSVNHLLFSKLSEEEQSYEIESSYSYLESVVGQLPIRTFCYPYGHEHSFTPTTEKLLTQAKSLFSFNVEARDIVEEDIRLRPQALPRYDCNAFPFGQASGSA